MAFSSFSAFDAFAAVQLLAPQRSVVVVVFMVVSVNHDAFSHYHAVGHQVVIYGFDYLNHGIMVPAAFIRMTEFLPQQPFTDDS